MFSPCSLSLFPSSDRGTYRNKLEYTASCNLRLREKKLFFHDASRIRKIISSRDGRSCMVNNVFQRGEARSCAPRELYKEVSHTVDRYADAIKFTWCYI